MPFCLVIGAHTFHLERDGSVAKNLIYQKDEPPMLPTICPITACPIYACLTFLYHRTNSH